MYTASELKVIAIKAARAVFTEAHDAACAAHDTYRDGDDAKYDAAYKKAIAAYAVAIAEIK